MLGDYFERDIDNKKKVYETVDMKFEDCVGKANLYFAAAL